MTMYCASSGARVGAGTTQWCYGLDDFHITDTGTPANQDMQQATLNVLGDMGVQPATKQSELVAATASADSLPPVTTITAPAAGAKRPRGDPVTITGTCTDAGGGRVAWVEVSVDDGQTWVRATGTTSWSCSVAPSPLGPRTIRARAVDDSCNLEISGPHPLGERRPRATPCSRFGAATPARPRAAADSNPLEVGVKFRPNQRLHH